MFQGYILRMGFTIKINIIVSVVVSSCQMRYLTVSNVASNRRSFQVSRLYGSKFHLRYANGLKACGDNMGQQENLQTSDPGDFQKSLCQVKTAI